MFLISQIWCTVAHGNCMTGIRSGLRKQKLIKWITWNIDSVKYPIHYCIRHGVLNYKTMVYALSIINILSISSEMERLYFTVKILFLGSTSV